MGSADPLPAGVGWPRAACLEKSLPQVDRAAPWCSHCPEHEIKGLGLPNLGAQVQAAGATGVLQPQDQILQGTGIRGRRGLI